MNIYLQLDERFVIQNVISMQHNVISPLYIPYHELDYTMIGKLWDGEKAVDNPYPANYILTRLEFRNLFTMAEKIALCTETKNDPIIQIFMDDVNAAVEIDLRYPALKDGLMYIVSKGIITSERMDSILANEAN